MKGPNRLWGVELEMSDIDVSINALSHLNPIVENSETVGGSSFGFESLAGGRTQSTFDDVDLQFQENSDEIFDSM